METTNAVNANRREIVQLGTMPQLDLPAARVIALPLGLQPECPQHCAYHAIEAYLECVVCKGRPFVLIEHHWAHNHDSIFYTLDPRDGAAVLPRGVQPTCCGEPLTRVSE